MDTKEITIEIDSISDLPVFRPTLIVSPDTKLVIKSISNETPFVVAKMAVSFGDGETLVKFAKLPVDGVSDEFFTTDFKFGSAIGDIEHIYKNSTENAIPCTLTLVYTFSNMSKKVYTQPMLINSGQSAEKLEGVRILDVKLMDDGNKNFVILETKDNEIVPAVIGA